MIRVLLMFIKCWSVDPWLAYGISYCSALPQYEKITLILDYHIKKGICIIFKNSCIYSSYDQYQFLRLTF